MNHNDINPHLFILTSIHKLQNIFVHFLGNTEKIYNSICDHYEEHALLLAIFWLCYSWYCKYHIFDIAYFHQTFYNIKTKKVL